MRIIRTGILFLALTGQFGCAEDKISSPDFSSYPQTEAFQAFICNQTNANWNLVQQSNILTIASFLRADSVALQYSINETGHEFDVRNVYNFALEAAHRKQLDKNQLKELRSTIKKLPAENILPPIKRLVVVSFKDSANWVTRSYDRTNLPPAMHKIYDIIGERFETTYKNIAPPID
jgi:hypothetical protein